MPSTDGIVPDDPGANRTFQPSHTLQSRTFWGLIVSQFLAAFNDQAIHASAMFYAIHQEALKEATAISLMPILFFAPWAIFCTIAGYLSDRYSKRDTLVFWKVAEIVIAFIALAGFAMHSAAGSWVVLATVFLMGTHSAFFVPAKYGVMPEILAPSQLSNGNGVLESTSFLAVILGTVTGGILSSVFKGQEEYIGYILVSLSFLGAGASLLIRRMPAANPTRPFPRNLFKPLVENLGTLKRSRPLALAALGIAFFTFMVAFMRATMYMHGESQNPRWNEFKTSWVVAVVALGVGLGSPLAGRFSRGKIELGLVPLGAVGMIVACLAAALVLFNLPALIVCLILIGFFSGFYIVPLYTLLQHRAPKTSKGDLIATCNFINVTGAISASLLFFALVYVARAGGIARPVSQSEVAEGVLQVLEFRRGSTPVFARVQLDSGRVRDFGKPAEPADEDELFDETPTPAGTGAAILHVEPGLQTDSGVAVSSYQLRGVSHFQFRPRGTPLSDAYDQALVPRFLFIGAGLMTLGILILLCRQLPDFFVRALFWLRSQGQSRVQVVGVHNLPSNGPALLATNCDSFEGCMQVVSATDRFTRFLLIDGGQVEADDPPRLLRYLAARTGLVTLRPGTSTPDAWDKALQKAAKELDRGNLVGLTWNAPNPTAEIGKLLQALRDRCNTPILPVYRGPAGADRDKPTAGVFVAIGPALPPNVPADELARSIERLREAKEGDHG